MTTFRYKPDKIKYLTSINTLDTVHRKHVSEFEFRRKKISDLKSEITVIESKLSQLEKPESKSDPNTIDDIKKRSELKTRLQKINQDLFDIKNNVSELEYYSQTNDILLDYYNEMVAIQPINSSENVEYSPSNDTNKYDQINLERSDCSDMADHFKVIHDNDDNTNRTFTKKISKLEELNLLSQKRRKPKKITRRRVRKTDIVNTKSILDFFNDKSEKQEILYENEEDESSVKESPSQSSIEQTVSNKATLFDDYMTIIDKTYVSKERRNVIRICTNPKCGGVEKTLIQSEGFYVCQKCGEVEHAIIESEVPSHKDSITEKSKYPYKRLNHLVESTEHIYGYSISNISYFLFYRSS